MAKLSVADVLDTSIDERIAFVQDVWDSIAAVPSAIPLTDGQRADLDRRVDAWHSGELVFSPWEDVKKRRLNRQGL